MLMIKSIIAFFVLYNRQSIKVEILKYFKRKNISLNGARCLKQTNVKYKVQSFGTDFSERTISFGTKLKKFF